VIVRRRRVASPAAVGNERPDRIGDPGPVLVVVIVVVVVVGPLRAPTGGHRARAYARPEAANSSQHA
jgi:hypothetical protein